MELDVTSDLDFSNLLNAIRSLDARSQDVTIAVDLNGGTFGGRRIRLPAGISLFLFNGTLRGASPALVLEEGNLFLSNFDLTNGTDAPALLIAGGSPPSVTRDCQRVQRTINRSSP